MFGEKKLLMNNDEKGGLAIMPRKTSSSEGSSAVKEKITSCLAAGAESYGDLILDKGIKIDGRHIGNLRVKDLTSLVLIDTGATVQGSIEAGRVYIKGHVKGQIRAKSIAIYAGATVDGDMCYERIQVEDGAEVIGTVIKEEFTGVTMPATYSQEQGTAQVVSISK